MIENLNTGNLRIEVEKKVDGTTLRWLGECDLRDPDTAIKPYLQRFANEHPAIITLVLDFREIAFMNSSSVMPVLDFLRHASERGLDTHVIYDQKRDWQRVSFQCLRIVCKRLPHVHFD